MFTKHYLVTGLSPVHRSECASDGPRRVRFLKKTLWRHQMETFSALLALCVGHRWIPHTKASNTELWCFLWSAPWINDWVSNREAGNLRRHRVHHDVIVTRRQHCNFALIKPSCSQENPHHEHLIFSYRRCGQQNIFLQLSRIMEAPSVHSVEILDMGEAPFAFGEVVVQMGFHTVFLGAVDWSWPTMDEPLFALGLIYVWFLNLKAVKCFY